jgi:hypothetical protein
VLDTRGAHARGAHAVQALGHDSPGEAEAAEAFVRLDGLEQPDAVQLVARATVCTSASENPSGIRTSGRLSSDRVRM